MMRVTDAALCGHCFSPAFNEEKNRLCIKVCCEQRPQYIHENLVTDLMLSEIKRLQFFFFVQSDGPSFDVLLKTVATTLAKEILTLEKQRLSTTLRHLATGRNFEDLQLIRVISKAIGIVVLGDLFTVRQTDRQTITGWILHNTVHILLNMVHNTLCQIIDTMYCATLQYYL
jgi:hypothetical protein